MIGLRTLPGCLSVLALNPQLLEVGNVVNRAEEDLQKDGRRLACLKPVVAEEVLVLLVLL